MEEWYASTGSVCTAWATFEAGFKARFPGVQKAKKMVAELEREMLEIELKVDDLDKTELYGRVEVETYKIHTKKLLDFAKHTKIDAGTVNIVFVQDKLPQIIKEKVAESHTNWSVFCAAIEAVDKTYIREGVRKHRNEEAKYNNITSRLNHVKHLWADNQVSPITTQVSCINLSSQIPQAGNLPNKLLPPPQNTCQAGPCQHGIASEEEKALVRANILKFTHHPNTPEGCTPYFEQLWAWKATHGKNAPINAHTPFPLHLGMAPVCSGECYTCRMRGHMGGACTGVGAAKIPPQEGRWCALCGRCLGRNRWEQATPVNQVAQVGEFAWARYKLYEDNDQGNGWGQSSRGQAKGPGTMVHNSCT